MWRRSSTLFSAVALGGLLALAGCGGSGSSNASLPKDPKGELTASVGNVADSDTLTVTLKLEIPAATLQALAAKNGDKLTTADAEAISSAQLVVEAKTSDGSNLSEKKTG